MKDAVFFELDPQKELKKKKSGYLYKPGLSSTNFDNFSFESVLASTLPLRAILKHLKYPFN